VAQAFAEQHSRYSFELFGATHPSSARNMVFSSLFSSEAPAKAPSVPGEFWMTLKSSNQKLGCSLIRASGKGLLIGSIERDGRVWAWNREHPASQVQKGDRIVEVDGVCGNTQKMLRRLRRSREDIQLRLQPRTAEDIQQLLRRLQRRDLTPEDFDLLGLLDDDRPQKAETHAVDSLVRSLPCNFARECNEAECAVCLRDFEADLVVTQLPCGHCFCTSCIYQWLSQAKRHCPCCTKSIEFPSCQHSNNALEATSCQRSSQASEDNSTESGSDDTDDADFDEGFELGPMHDSGIYHSSPSKCFPICPI